MTLVRMKSNAALHDGTSWGHHRTGARMASRRSRDVPHLADVVDPHRGGAVQDRGGDASRRSEQALFGLARRGALPMKLLRDVPTSTGLSRPRRATRSSRRSVRLCSSVLPKPMPGSTKIDVRGDTGFRLRGRASPREKVFAPRRRRRRSAARCCIVSGSPLMCIRTSPRSRCRATTCAPCRRSESAETSLMMSAPCFRERARRPRPCGCRPRSGSSVALAQRDRSTGSMRLPLVLGGRRRARRRGGSTRRRCRGCRRRTPRDHREARASTAAPASGKRLPRVEGVRGDRFTTPMIAQSAPRGGASFRGR